ncbi:MAG: Cof-type HAD-IIB family hydrolase [Clostridium sp.]
MAIKLICTDMDGTLLSSDHTISYENKEALKLASEKGILIAITTGRLYTSAKYYAHLIGVNGPVICSNGAFIKNIKNEEVIYTDGFTSSESLKILEILSKYNISTYFNTFDSVLSFEDFPEDYPFVKSNKSLPEEYKINLIVDKDIKNHLTSNDGKILKAISFSIGKSHDDLLKAKAELLSTGEFEVVSSGPHNFEVMKKGTSKGNAIKKLAQILGINQDEIMCIGDSENDLSMIKYAGIGVAMGNALDEVKEIATFVTDTNDNSGVGKAILKILN